METPTTTSARKPLNKNNLSPISTPIFNSLRKTNWKNRSNSTRTPFRFAGKNPPPPSLAVPHTPLFDFTTKKVTLLDWWLIKVLVQGSNHFKFGVGGNAFDGQASTYFSSGEIVKRHDEMTLETVDGITITLASFLNRSSTLENGFPSQLWEAYSKESDVLKNEEYIEERLGEMYGNFESDQQHDLFTISTYFRIFRQHGYNISSDVFSRFKIEGKFDEAISKDQMGALSLYEAAQLRTSGEAILDEALAFTTSHLNAMAKINLESGSLSRQIMHALEQPLHKGLPRIEAKHFISFYEEDPSRNELLLKFAKLDFNLVQMLYKQELSQVNRFDLQSIEGLQGHSKVCYITCLNVLREFDDEITKKGRYYDVSYLKEVFKANLICYHIEAKWRDINYVPPFEEYFQNALTSSGIWILGVASILGMGHVDTVQACEWALTKPKAILVAEANARIINDIVGFEEEHSRPHVATSIDCYTKEYGVSKEEAVAKLDEMIDNTWKDMNEACLRPTPLPMHFITIFLNFMRVCYVTYKAGDGYTHPEQQLKDEIKFMLLDPILI